MQPSGRAGATPGSDPQLHAGRRVGIAVELLTSPCLLFLDEPTTGLDSTNAAQVVDVLSDLSLNGVNVILSIHQPRADILRLMNRALLLSGLGRVVYNGPVSYLQRHLDAIGVPVPPGTLNMADFLLDTTIGASRSSIEAMIADYDSSELAERERDHVLRLRVRLPCPRASCARARFASVRLPACELPACEAALP